MERIQRKNVYTNIPTTINAQNNTRGLRARGIKKGLEIGESICAFFGMESLEEKAALYKMLFVAVVIAIIFMVWNHYDVKNDWEMVYRYLEGESK